MKATMRLTRSYFKVLCIILVFTTGSVFCHSKPDKIAVLIVDGFSKHDWKQTTLIRATEWLATGKVSYKVPQNFPGESELSLVNEVVE